MMSQDGTLAPHNQAEKAFYNWFRNCFEDCFLQRIESTTTSGIPDLFYAMPWPNNMIDIPQTGWIEFKIHLKGKGVLLRKEQYAWITRAHQHKLHTLVIALNEKDVEIYHTFEVEPYGGKARKYVRITSRPGFIVPKRRQAIREYFGLQ